MKLADLPTERAVLGGLLIFPELIPVAVTDRLEAECFAAPGHAAVFKALVKIGPEAILAGRLSAPVGELRRAGDLGLISGAAGVVGLMIAFGDSAPDPDYGDSVPDYARARDLLPVSWERFKMLASARRVQGLLRAALLAVQRDPVCARALLAAIPRAA